MNKTKSDIEVVFIHDNIPEHSYVVTRLKEDFENVRLISDPDEGTQYLAQHAADKIIVVLDINFGDGVTNGYQVLDAIRERTFLLEVIILSADDLPDTNVIERIPQLIGLNPSNYIIRGKGKWMDNVIESVTKAKIHMDNSISGAIEEWISIQDQRKRSEPYIVSAYGKEYTLDDILKEIRLQTEFGQRFKKDLLMLTIDRLLRGKENLK